MTRLPSLTGDRIVKALTKAGFTVDRQRGSHFYLKHPDGRATVVPVHKGGIRWTRACGQNPA